MSDTFKIPLCKQCDVVYRRLIKNTLLDIEEDEKPETDVVETLTIDCEQQIVKCHIIAPLSNQPQNQPKLILDVVNIVLQYYELDADHGIQYEIGDTVEAMDSVGKWREAEIMDKKYTNQPTLVSQLDAAEDIEIEYLIHYSGWSSKWDEWFKSQQIGRLHHLGHFSKQTSTNNFLVKDVLRKTTKIVYY